MAHNYTNHMMPHNVERSVLRRGEYVGYARGVWRICQDSGGWRAARGAEVFHRRTLAAVSEELERRGWS